MIIRLLNLVGRADLRTMISLLFLMKNGYMSKKKISLLLKDAHSSVLLEENGTGEGKNMMHCTVPSADGTRPSIPAGRAACAAGLR